MIDPQHIINLRGKSYPTWPGVLDAATRAGLKSLTTTVLQMPTAENGGLAVVMARAEFEDGRVFQDIGDCSPLSTSAHLAAASLRLASTRAKGRCLRDAINVGQTMFEELPGTEPEEGPAAAAPAPANGNGIKGCEECGVVLTSGQAAISTKNYNRSLCPACQKKVFR